MQFDLPEQAGKQPVGAKARKPEDMS